MSYSLFILEVLDIAKEKDMPINEQIRAKQMLVIGPNGEQLGIKSKDEALTLASYAGFDLVLINNGENPVCKLMDYNKFKYEKKKKQKESQKRQKENNAEMKEYRLSPNIDTNDLNTKVGAARKFITKGDKVKVTLRFRGREMAHMNSSKYILDEFAESLSDIATDDQAPKVEASTMTMYMTAKRKNTLESISISK